MAQKQTSISVPEWGASVLEKLLVFCSTDFLCDAKLTTSDSQSYRAHSAVLSAASPVLHAMILQQRQNRQHKHLPCTDYSLTLNITSEILELLLKFFYQGSLTVDSACFDDILAAAEYLEVYAILAAVPHSPEKLSDANHRYNIGRKVARAYSDDDYDAEDEGDHMPFDSRVSPRNVTSPPKKRARLNSSQEMTPQSERPGSPMRSPLRCAICRSFRSSDSDKLEEHVKMEQNRVDKQIERFKARRKSLPPVSKKTPGRDKFACMVCRKLIPTSQMARHLSQCWKVYENEASKYIKASRSGHTVLPAMSSKVTTPPRGRPRRQSVTKSAEKAKQLQISVSSRSRRGLESTHQLSSRKTQPVVRLSRIDALEDYVKDAKKAFKIKGGRIVRPKTAAGEDDQRSPVSRRSRTSERRLSLAKILPRTPSERRAASETRTPIRKRTVSETRTPTVLRTASESRVFRQKKTPAEKKTPVVKQTPVVKYSVNKRTSSGKQSPSTKKVVSAKKVIDVNSEKKKKTGETKSDKKIIEAKKPVEKKAKKMKVDEQESDDEWEKFMTALNLGYITKKVTEADSDTETASPSQDRGPRRLHRCETCQMFVAVQDLQQHMLVHSKEREKDGQDVVTEAPEVKQATDPSEAHITAGMDKPEATDIKQSDIQPSEPSDEKPSADKQAEKTTAEAKPAETVGNTAISQEQVSEQFMDLLMEVEQEAGPQAGPTDDLDSDLHAETSQDDQEITNTVQKEMPVDLKEKTEESADSKPEDQEIAAVIEPEPEQPFWCRMCRQFYLLKDVDKHIAEEKASIDKQLKELKDEDISQRLGPHTCSICHLFVSYAKVEEHTRVCWRKYERQVNIYKQRISDETLSPYSQPIRCLFCRAFITTSNVDLHMNRHRKKLVENVEATMKSVTDTKQSDADSTDSKPSHACGICKTTVLTETLMEHTMECWNKLKERVNDIKKEASRKTGKKSGSYLPHMACKLCGQMMPPRSVLRHVMKVHPPRGTEAYAKLEAAAVLGSTPKTPVTEAKKCIICGKFVRNMNRHMKTHKEKESTPATQRVKSQALEATPDMLVKMKGESGMYLCTVCKKDVAPLRFEHHMRGHNKKKKLSESEASQASDSQDVADEVSDMDYEETDAQPEPQRKPSPKKKTKPEVDASKKNEETDMKPILQDVEKSSPSITLKKKAEKKAISKDIKSVEKTVPSKKKKVPTATLR